MTIYGYARVSTGRQDTENQIPALVQAGCEEIITETVSGASQVLPLRDALLDRLQEGDTLVVVALDRLGRRSIDMLTIVENLTQRGVELRFLREGVDTATPTGQLVLTVMAGIAEMERAILIERTKAGMDRARRAGTHIGRPHALTDAQIELVWSLWDSGRTVRETAELLGVSTRTIDRARARRPVDHAPPAVA